VAPGQAKGIRIRNNADKVIGMVVGLIIRLSPGRSIQDSVTFDYQFFFNLLLPPIILASGYELHQVSRELNWCIIARRIVMAQS
jgi:hypothetical protein